MSDERLMSRTVRSTIGSGGGLRVTLDELPVHEPRSDQVVVRMEATPLNPSDLGALLGPVDLSTLRREETPDGPVLTGAVPEEALDSVRGRFDQALPVGNEGAGTVIRAGASAQSLLGRTVGVSGGGMYAQLRTVAQQQCVLLPEDASAQDGAAMFVNPLTALAMLATMRREGHGALVHTAAASNLGQMLTKLCVSEKVGLVNVVRSSEQDALLASLGAEHVVDSTASTFPVDLTDAIAATGATLAFDAVGGGPLVDAILQAMEAAATRGVTEYDPYGSTTLKQVYVYGHLDEAPTTLSRTYGTEWSVGGFVLPRFLQRAGEDEARRMLGHVARDLLTTFASTYSRTIALSDLLSPDVVAVSARRGTGAKYLIDPSGG